MHQPIVPVKCTKCKLVKPDADFHNNNAATNGLCSWCKVCKNDYRRETYAELREYFHPGQIWDKGKREWVTDEQAATATD